MTYIIITQPHPLDNLWGVALEAVQAAEDMFEALGEDYTNDEANSAGAALSEALGAVWALPARNMSDIIVKLNLADLDGATRDDCPVREIMNEATEILDAGIARGTKLKALNPEFLEGVTL
ncbi:hypothetical protein K9B33_17870 [Sphingobium sp. 3R8]|uniref:hypothetical protein n=1 Tax=Sphingobium sp. 3R8 TaxID=2874921 RepID=UPI001CCDABB6|nr:hypothetical protein [Sphingobium sp. 3R8]MBZ9649406.1 hypothetical protein [Sphingobium sp. 3R8]